MIDQMQFRGSQVRNPGVYAIAAGLLLCLFGAACAKHESSPEVAALENAYKSGVLTKDEYTAKKAMIEGRAARLAALDEALRSGILTKDEYLAKKAALVAPAPV